MTGRPWRAVAYFAPDGLPPLLLSRTSAKTRQGLDQFVDGHTATGARVTVWRVITLEEPHADRP